MAKKETPEETFAKIYREYISTREAEQLQLNLKNTVSEFEKQYKSKKEKTDNKDIVSTDKKDIVSTDKKDVVSTNKKDQIDDKTKDNESNHIKTESSDDDSEVNTKHKFQKIEKVKSRIQHNHISTESSSDDEDLEKYAPKNSKKFKAGPSKRKGKSSPKKEIIMDDIKTESSSSDVDDKLEIQAKSTKNPSYHSKSGTSTLKNKIKEKNEEKIQSISDSDVTEDEQIKADIKNIESIINKFEEKPDSESNVNNVR